MKIYKQELELAMTQAMIANESGPIGSALFNIH
jgi:hypothetical protein